MHNSFIREGILVNFECVTIGRQSEARQPAEGAAVGVALQLPASGRSEEPETGGIDGQSAAAARGRQECPGIAGELLVRSNTLVSGPL